MKKIKNAMLLAIGSLTVMTVAMTSCTSKPNPTPAPTVTAVTGTTSAGGAITIAGTGFTSTGTTATIGGISFTVTFVSSTSLTATVPSSLTTPGSYNVIVTVNGTASTAFPVTIGLPPVGPYTSSDQVESANRIAKWTFDNTLAEDVSGLSPTLSSGSSSYTYVTGKVGTAISLTNGWLTYPSSSGSNHIAPSFDNTTFGSNDTLQNGYTFSVWVKVPVSPVDGGGNALLGAIFQLNTTIDQWGGYGLAYRKHADSSFDFDADFFNIDFNGPHFSYGTYYAGNVLKDTASWAFLAMVYDTTGGRHLKYYTNGSLVATKDVSAAFVHSATEPLLIPAPNYASFGTFQGTDQTTSAPHVPGATSPILGFQTNGITGVIDDARLFKATLSATEVNDLYLLGNQGR
jgi:IPT/TIG domain-containing protein/concanavalin A-like lectin/glucanase superfamily protein